MGRFLTNQDFHAKRKSVTMELLKGKEIATRLQAFLLDRARESDPCDIGLDSARQLAFQILRSFAEAISAFSSCGEMAQTPAVDRAVKKASPRVKDRRGCYKRRRTSDSWITMSPTKEDGFAWRKYGQKVIMNSEHPRCYFRCTHKPEGCKATKQVQRTNDDDPITYQTTYYNHHTCTETPQVLVVDPSLISFRSSDNPMLHQDQYSPNPMSSVVQQEFKEDINGVSDHDFSSNEVKSTLRDANIAASCFDNSFDSTSLHMLDMEEVNELGDLDYSSLYFD